MASADAAGIEVPEILRRALDHHRAGRLPDAERLYHSILQIEPRHADAHYNLGVSSLQSGRTSEALCFFEAAVAADPHRSLFRTTYLETLAATGRAPEPSASSPTGPHRDLAAQMLLHGEHARAERLALAMTLAHPSDSFGWKVLGVARAETGRLPEAVQAMRMAVRVAHGDAEAHNNLGNVLERLGRLDEAATSFRRAVAIAPNYAEAHNNLGNALSALGRFDEARASLHRALSLRPDYAACHENLARLKTFRPGDPQLDVLDELHRTTRKDTERKYVCFALAKACEDLGQIDRAFALYAEGNTLAKRERRYAIDADRQLFGRIEAAFAAPVFAAPADAAPLPTGRTTPILIVGMPRSGTSLVEQILASHGEVLGGGELEVLGGSVRRHAAFGSDTFDVAAASRAITSDYLHALTAIGDGRRYVTDKMPFNFLWLGFLLLAQPQIKVIHTVRDPVATCWSMFRLHFPAASMGFAYDLADLADYYRLYARLMRFWHERFPGRILDLHYERLTENQADETRRLLAHCGLPWDDRCLAFEKTARAVRTASAAQVRAKMYRGSSDAWRKFEAHLGPLVEGLAAP